MGRRLVNDGASALGGRDPCIFGGRGGALAKTAAGREADHAIDDLVPGSQQKPKRSRDAVAAHGKLPHFLRHPPDAAAAGGEKGHVPWPESMNPARVVGDERFTLNNVRRLVDGVIAFETAGRAGPRHD